MRAWSRRQLLVLLVVLVFVVGIFLHISYTRLRTPAPGLKDDDGIHHPLTGIRPTFPKNKQVVLVTGAAGFVGFHVARALATQWEALVVGLDTFNEYYDVQLKKDRASNLLEVGVKVYRGDVCDRTLLLHLFDKFEFTGVIHLAAQAGVRHSMKDPLVYINNNVRCFLTLLQILRNYKHIPLVFASSSTVYGHYSPLPFSPSNTLFAPSNVYAASKISNEHFADVFCTQYGLSTVGVRFFTVYGPWGRPDMAVYKFAESIYSKKPLPFFKSTEPVGRDFTYVSDITSGVLLALEHTPTRCAEVYNLGFGNTVDLNRLLELLQAELNMTAIVDYQPLPASDLASTLADISESRSVLGYESSVSVDQGVKEFVKWFKEYKALRAKKEEEQRNKNLKSVLAKGEKERSMAILHEVEKDNIKYRERIQTLKGMYLDYAREKGLELPANLSNKQFIFHAGVDSPGHTIIRTIGGSSSKEVLMRQCQQTEQCVGFTSSGEFKNELMPPNKWTSLSDPSPSDGLYVADVDMCATDLHNCKRHQACRHIGPSNYECICREGFAKIGSGCVTKYKEGVLSEVEEKLERSDYFDGVDWKGTAVDKQFVFFQGMDSVGGDFLLVEEGSKDVDGLMKICRERHHCLGFNTNGLLKHSLQSPRKWVHWTTDISKGLYVLDVDYCELDQDMCPPDSSCHRFSAGNYSCQCNSPLVMSSDYTCKHRREAQVGTKVRDVSAPGVPTPMKTASISLPIPTNKDVHIILSSDEAALAGIPAVITSALTNTRFPHRLKFHVVLANVNKQVFDNYLRCFPPLLHQPSLDVVELPTQFPWHIKVNAAPQTNGNLQSLANFGRFLFYKLFPEVRRALYFDVDTVIRGDVVDLWEQFETSDQLLMVAFRKSPKLGSRINSRARSLFKTRYGKDLNTEGETFNAGVCGMNLERWRNDKIYEEVEYWMNKHAASPMWNLGTQPIMLLIGQGRLTPMDPLWNVDKLGYTNVPVDLLRRAKLLHWTGVEKPWTEKGRYKELWSPYAPPACSGSGQCLPSFAGKDITDYKCKCQDGFYGERCQTTLADS